MDLLLDRQGSLYKFLDQDLRDLIEDCEKLIDDAHQHPKSFTDYSYLVFPVAKMYEGFLKKLFWDLAIINQEQYYSDHFRIGKALNPNLEQHLRLESVYDKLCSHFEGEVIADSLWQAWKRGRNSLFHFFPGRLSRISLEEAEFTIKFMLEVSKQAVDHSGLDRKPIPKNYEKN